MAITDTSPTETSRGSRLSALWLPVTYTYAAILVLVTAVLAFVNDSTATRFVLHVSTNLHNLSNGHFGTLFASAFVIDGAVVAAFILPGLICLLALAERRFGALTLIRTFIAGHIGATILVALGLWISVATDWMPRNITMAEDVGVSYGAMAIVGALVSILPAHRRTAWVVVWLGLASGGVIFGQTFTNVGHVLALSLGLAYGYFRQHRHPHPIHPLNRWEFALLAIGSGLSAMILLG
ncbi:rhomboid-like protein [Nocardia sp. NPDC051030]|uniref:rhomboid-like protein n=1 Tax=Nocardia sp. NPDC051030 TaxID=3155162 RepID=UPI00342D2634